MFGSPSRYVVWQCKKCRRCFAIIMTQGTKNPNCPECESECNYVIAT